MKVLTEVAEPVVVPGPVPVPGVGEAGEMLLVHPAPAMAAQRSISKSMEILEFIVKFASLSYIMLVLSEKIHTGTSDFEQTPHNFC